MQLVLVQHETRPVIVLAVRQYELHLMVRLEQGDILQTIVVLFPGARRFQVHDHRNALIHSGNIHGATGFQAHLVTVITQRREQRQAVRLGQRFATGHRHVLRPMGGYLLANRRQGPFLPPGKGIFRITPDTALRAAGQAHKYRRAAHGAGFTL